MYACVGNTDIFASRGYAILGSLGVEERLGAVVDPLRDDAGVLHGGARPRQHLVFVEVLWV